MAIERVYLDYNATAPVLPAAREAAVHALGIMGNPSSVHAEGRAARQIVDHARTQVAALLKVSVDRVTFTSGGTEAAVLALQPEATGAGNLLLVAAGEHPCVLEGHGFSQDRARVVPLDADGRICLEALGAALDAAGERGVTLALQAANNETGVVQPVAEASAMVRKGGGKQVGGKIVCDAVQVAGRLDCLTACAGADLVVLSGHKMGGIKGVGALVSLSGLLEPAAAVLRGGGQEKGLRAGTENVPAIAAFGAAAQWALENQNIEARRLEKLRNAFEMQLASRFPDAVIFGQNSPRLANTSAFAIPGVSAETLLIALDLAGLSVSSGSACSSGKVKSSHVLEAMGVEPQIARGAIRVSLGHRSQGSDMEKLLAGLDKSVARINSRTSAIQTAA
jgi:cysteine desulfurase